MKVNAFLCKHFKDSDERYVTVAGFLQWLGIYVAVLFIIAGITASFMITISRIATGQYGKSTDLVIALAEIAGYLVLVAILFIVSSVLWDRLSAIKLAECPLEKEDEKP